MPAKKKASIDSLTFEEAMKELEALVQRLEAGDLPLEESLALYERGQRLAVRLIELLDKAELRITQLSPNGVDELEDEMDDERDGAEG